MLLSLSASSDVVLARPACVFVGTIGFATLQFTRIEQAGSTYRAKIRANRDVNLVELGLDEKTIMCIDVKANELVKDLIPDASGVLNSLAKGCRC